MNLIRDQTGTQANTTGPTFLTRIIMFGLSTLALSIVLTLFYPASPSERFHIVVPLVWALDFILFRLKQMRLRWGVIVSIAIGIFIGLYCFLMLRADRIGGRVDVREPLWWMLFLTSVLVLYHWLYVILTQFFKLVPAMRERLTTPNGWWLRSLRGGIAIILFTPYLYTACNIHRFKIANAPNPQQSYSMSYEPVRFSATDGVLLDGWFIPAQGSKDTVLICHGISANKGNFLGFVPFLHRAGFNVFIFDFRGHGDSPGHTISFGYYEARDVRGAVKYLSNRSDTKNIIGYGFSMGGSSLLHAMPDLPTLRGVVVDSTFADMTLLSQEQMTFLPGTMRDILMSTLDFWTRRELGTPIAFIAPRRHIGVISPRPLLIIHGTADDLIPPSQATLNFAAAGQPRELWLVRGAGHIEPMYVQGKEYQSRVIKFLKQCVKAPATGMRGAM